MTPAIDLDAGEDTGEAFVRFAEARGKRVFQADGVRFVQYRPPFYISVPWQRRVDLPPDVLWRAMRTARAWAVRYPGRSQPGWPCGMYATSLPGFDLSRLSPKRRRLVRRGLESATCRSMDPDELEALGLELNLQTMARHRRFDPEFGDPARWRALIGAIRRCPGISLEGAFVDGRLSDYHVNLRDGRWLHLLFKMSRTDDLKRNSGAALDYWTLEQAGRDPSLLFAESGFTSLVSDDRLLTYKRELGFSVVPFELALRFHPRLEPLLASRLAARAAWALWRLSPGTRALDVAAHVLAGAHRTRVGVRVLAR